MSHRSSPARELLYEFLKEREVGEAISWRQISEAIGVENAQKSHRTSVNWVKERIAEEYGKTLSPPTSRGFIMVPVSMREERVFWPGECTECTLSGVPKNHPCKHRSTED